MDPDIKRLLELTEDNNKMLHKMRNAQKIAALWSTLKFIFVVAIFLGSIYYLQPYLNKAMDLYNSASKIIPK